MKIGDRIKKRRVELGYSVDEVADKLGKNRATVYRYESNEIENLPITTLEPLAKALNTTPAHLMGWEEDPQDYTPPKTIAAHATEDLTEEEQEKVREYIQFLKMKRGL